jgi:hypothetical protein
LRFEESEIMNRFQEHATADKSRYCTPGTLANCVCVLLLAAVTAVLSSCGSSSSNSQQSGPLSANWDFSKLSPGTSFTGGLQGGFLVQNGSSITGQAVYSISIPAIITGPCDSGAATITGNIAGSTVTLTAVAGSALGGVGETFGLTGTLGSDSSGHAILTNVSYTYTPTAPQGGTPCGSKETVTPTKNLVFSVPSLTGAFQGFLHSVTGGASLDPQDFAVSGNLVQGLNLGESYATLNGTLIFKDPATQLNNYPCLSTASVSGVVSGSNVSLQIYGSNGLVVGQIGSGGNFTVAPVTVSNSSSGGLMLQGHLGYALTTKSCPTNGGPVGDNGNICLAFGGSAGCTLPIIISPFSTTFLPQLLGSTPTTQAITISNVTSSPLANVKIQLTESDSQFFYQLGGGDFNGIPSFTVLSTGQANDCTTLAPLGSTFTLATSCQVTVQFAPQESCPWLPSPFEGNSTPPFVEKPSLCPNPLTADLMVTVPNSDTEDSDGSFSAPISGTGLSAVAPSTGELDFGPEAIGETSPPQTLTFTNQSPNAVQILPGSNTCNTLNQQNLPYPLAIGSPVAGFQIDRTGFPQAPNTLQPGTIQPEPNATPPTVSYACDFDAQTKAQNFQIAPAPASTCLAAGQGVVLQPQQSCTLQITFAPQPEAWNTIPLNSPIGLDYFLEFNTVQCSSGESNCEIDSGRFPVELKTNPPSPLRLSPSAGLEFGTVIENTTSAPLTVTLFNDPVDPNSATVNIVSKIISGDYLELDNCPSSLVSNQGCPITITFKPKVIGLDYGSLIITYDTPTQIGLVQTIFLRGTGQ